MYIPKLEFSSGNVYVAQMHKRLRQIGFILLLLDMPIYA